MIGEVRIDRRALPGYLRELASLAPARAAERIERDAAAGQLAPEVPAAVLSFLSAQWTDAALVSRIRKALGDSAEYGSGAAYHARDVAEAGPAAKPTSAAAQTRAIETARIKRVAEREAEEERRPRGEDPPDAFSGLPVVLDELELLGLSLSGTAAVSIWAQDDAHRPVFLGFSSDASPRAWVQRKGGPQVPLTSEEVAALQSVLREPDAAAALNLNPADLQAAIVRISSAR